MDSNSAISTQVTDTKISEKEVNPIEQKDLIFSNKFFTMKRFKKEEENHQANLDFNYYHYMDVLKNTLHRHLSSAKSSSIFFPRFYYSWFYVDERTLYNIACLKQRLGPNIDQNDLDAYNQMRVIYNK
jgi:hypothetical protein